MPCRSPLEPRSAGSWRRSSWTGRPAAPGRSARPRTVRGGRRCSRRSALWAVELRREESRRRPQDRVRPAQLTHLALQLADPGTVKRRRPRPFASIDLRGPDPLAQRLRADRQLVGDPGNHPELLALLLDRLQDQTHRPLLQLRRIPPRGRSHGSSVPSKSWSLHRTQGGSAHGFVSLGTTDLRTETYAIVGDLRGDGPSWLWGSTVLGD